MNVESEQRNALAAVSRKSFKINGHLYCKGVDNRYQCRKKLMLVTKIYRTKNSTDDFGISSWSVTSGPDGGPVDRPPLNVVWPEKGC